MDPYASAKAILPFVFDRWVKSPRFLPTVLDVGCGGGGWLRAAKEFGAMTVGVDKTHAPVGVDVMLDFDLIAVLRDPYREVSLSPKYDLAICLEVAEHLPPDCGPKLVEFLCEMSGVILFSAAHPGQGPYPPEGALPEAMGCWHINEQPLSYWEEQFRSCGFKQLDVIRGRFAQDVRVDPWYKENACVYVEGS